MKKTIYHIGLWMALLATGSLRAWVISPTASDVLYTDPGATPQQLCNYYSYEVFNDTLTDASDVWVTATGFSTSDVALGSGEDGIYHIGSILAGQRATAFFYYCTPLLVDGGAATSYSISVYTSQPPGVAVASSSLTMTVKTTISANPNSVSSVVVSPNPPEIGGTFDVVVTGATGTIGAAQIIAFTPASDVGWPASCYRLSRSSIAMNFSTPNTYVDKLMIPRPLPSTGNTSYVATYTFRLICCSVASGTKASPEAYISSGVPVKHTDGNPSSAVIQAGGNFMQITKTTTVNPSVQGDQVQYFIGLINTGSTTVTIDSFDDNVYAFPTVPVQPVYVAGSTTFGTNAYPTANPSSPEPSVTGTAGTVLHWGATYDIPPGQTGWLGFKLDFLAGGIYHNDAWGLLGDCQIDSTLDPNDDSPYPYDQEVFTPTDTPTYTNTPTSTMTFTDSPTPSATPTNSDTPTYTPTSTPTPTYTMTFTDSPTPTHTPTSTDSPTPTDSPTLTETPTDTPTYTSTFTDSPTPTDSPTSTVTPTWTPTFTWSATKTSTPTISPTQSRTPTRTATPQVLLLHLYPASPNPFGYNGCYITYWVQVDATVKIKVYDVSGELVKTLEDHEAKAGNNNQFWNGRNDSGINVASGTYIYKVEATSKRQEFQYDWGKVAAAR
ncbi:MAG: FlgD immunoglobulin-like domain containing protein [candidate division FCPU426 bacterium]